MPWGRRLLLGLLGVVGLVLLLALGALLYLFSDAGEARVLRRGLAAANTSLAGQVEARELELGFDGVSLAGVELRDPEGEVVARAERLEAQVSLPALLRQRVLLREVRLVRPELLLVEDARGLNLARAVAPREEKPEPPQGGGSAWTVDLESLRLSDGSIDLRQETEAGERRVTLAELGAQGKASWAGPTGALDATLGLRGAMVRPTRGPVQLDVAAQGRGEELSARVGLVLAGLTGQAELTQEPGAARTLVVQSLALTPETGRALLPDYPLQVPVRLTGRAVQRGDAVSPDLTLSAGQARAHLTGLFDVARLTASPLTLDVTGVDLQELLGEPGAQAGQSGALLARLRRDSATTPLQAHLTVEGGGQSLETLEGRLALDVPPARLGGEPVGPVRLRASAEGGRLHVQELHAVLPGLTARAEGSTTRERMQLAGRLDARDLGTLARTLRLPGGLTGSGALSFRLEGPPTHPGLWLDGRLASFTYGDSRARNVTLRARVPDVERPLEAEGELRADALASSGKRFEDVSLALARQGRALRADLRAGGSTPLTLHLGGTVEGGGRALGVQALTLATPQVEWQLQGPTRVSFEDGLRLAPTTLTAPGQVLTARATLVDGQLDAALTTKGLDLARLPAAFVDRELALAGTLDADVTARGRLPRPAVKARVSLAGGGYEEYRGVDAVLDATYVGDRARGTLSAKTSAGGAHATFDVPVQATLRGRHAPLSLELTLEEARVERALQLLHRKEPYAGALSGTLQVHGMASDPRLSLALHGTDLRMTDARGQALPPLAADLTLQSDGEGGALGGRLEVRGLAREAWVALRTPLSVASLREAAARPEALRDAELQLEGRVDALPLRLVQALGLVSQADGTASLELAARGSLRAPVGKARLTLAGAVLEGRPPLDGTLTVDAQGARTLATVRGALAGQPLVEAQAELGAGLSQVQTVEALSHVPFTLTATAGPVSIAQVSRLRTAVVEGEAETGGRAGGPAAVDNRAFPAAPAVAGVQAPPTQQPPFDGRARATLSMQGTLAAPEARLKLALAGLGRGQLALGTADVTWSYADARNALDAVLTAPGGGVLKLAGTSALDLSLPALRRGVDLQGALVDARLDSQGFALDFLSGATQTVRRVGGVLDAHATLRGPLLTPSVEGQLEWREGRVALAGYGEYRDMHVRLAGSRERLRLEDFSARSGGGTLHLTGQAERAGSGYQLRGQGRTDRFPLVYDDQLLATASMDDVTFSGTYSGESLYLQRLAIPDATIELPEMRRKDLQELDRPEDVVLVRNGVPVSAAQRRRTLAARRQAREGQPRATGGAGDEEEAPQGMRYTVLLDAPRNIWVKGSDVNVELGFSDQFRIEYAQRALMFGEMRVLRGRVSVLGRAFDIQRDSQVRFTGPATQPYINVAAVHTNEREGVTVTMNIRGQGKDFTLKPTSNPPLPENEIYTLLATGRRTLKRNSGSASGTAQAASIVGSLLTGQAKKVLASKLPLDVFSVDAGDDLLKGTRVEVGRYLGDKLYVGYSQRFGQTSNVNEDSGSAKVEYQFDPRWSLEGEVGVGSRNKSGADLIWSTEF